MTQHAETAEWLNLVLDRVWKIMNPKLMTAAIDILEDTMASQCPPVLDNIKVVEFELGQQAPRIIRTRVYPFHDNDDFVVRNEI